jgi:hypothetical protein
MQRIPRPPTDGTLRDFKLSEYMSSRAHDLWLQEAMSIQLAHRFIDANPCLEDLRCKIPFPPAILPLVPKPSSIYPVPLQNVDESTIDGQKDYFELTLKKYLGLPSEWFQHHIVPMYGDNFTVMRIRQLAEQHLENTTKDPFKKSQYMEPAFGPLHLLVGYFCLKWLLLRH